MKKAVFIPCDKNYLPGLKVTLFSLRRNGNLPEEVDICVISEDIHPNSVRSFGAKIVRPKTEDYDELPQSSYWPPIVHYTYESLRSEYERVVWIGADQLIVGDISELFHDDAPPFMAMVDSQHPDGVICTGMLAVTVSAFPNMWEQVMELALAGDSYDGGDQGVMNAWVETYEVPIFKYHPWVDVSKRVYLKDPKRWNQIMHLVKSIHFVGPEKPWMESTINNESEMDAYGPLHMLWRSYQEGAHILPLPQSVIKKRFTGKVGRMNSR